MVFSRVILLNYGIGGQFASLLFKYQVQELNFTIKNLWKDKEWNMIFSGMNLGLTKSFNQRSEGFDKMYRKQLNHN